MVKKNLKLYKFKERILIRITERRFIVMITLIKKKRNLKEGE